ncbi:MAG: glycosyl transferase [Actinomycetota bacterium]|nr:glycosyl transferase [Actinomycetota bacterium]
MVRRGHAVCLQSWERWRSPAEAEGMRFEPAPEYQVFPRLSERPLKPYQAAVHGAVATEPLIEDFDPDAVVVDILTVAASLAAERDGRRWATLIPHVLPTPEPGRPPYSTGARLPRTAVGARLWSLTMPLLSRGEDQGRRELNGARQRAGLVALEHSHGGISHQLALVATFPQLEYPRDTWDPWTRVTGPLLWEQPFEAAELPPGDEPLVLVAPSTSQDPDGRLLRAALDGLADQPVRVIATTNRRGGSQRRRVPANARLVDWLSYARTMPRCDVVVCHAGHGTVCRALACGVPLVACPAEGDMAENAARVAWAGAGVSLPRRLASARGIRLATRAVLADPVYTRRAADLAEWARRFDGRRVAADELERFTSS